jgi:hypothetical protein
MVGVVAAPKGVSGGRAALDLVSTGLAELRSSGRRFETALRDFGAYSMRVL